MYHYFYKITNNITGRYYYGVHSTLDLDDGYMGSGTVIKRHLKKFGAENFTKDVLKFFDSENEMFEYESQFVNDDLVNDPNCYNLVNGGKGYRLNHVCPEEVRRKISEKSKGRASNHKGFIYVNKNYKNKLIHPSQLNQFILDGWVKGIYLSEESRKKLCTRGMLGKHASEETRRKQSEIKKRQIKEGTFVPHNKGKHLSEQQKQHLREINTGKHHTEESKNKMSISRTGKKHSKSWCKNISKGLKGHVVSEETKKKIGAKNSKSIIRIDPVTKESVIFNSITEAEKYMGFKPACSGIRYAFKHNVIKHGYIWILKKRTIKFSR